MFKEKLIEIISDYFNEQIPFNKIVGIVVTEVSAETVVLKAKMRPELIGNALHGILHGGVTSTLLDVSGGLVAVINEMERLVQNNPLSIQEKLMNIATIDMRVDFLLPGRGEEFIATAKVIRHGKKVAVTRMELRNELNEKIALGTATYLVG